MTKPTLKLALAVAAGSLFASTAFAGPVSLTDAQLDAVAAGVDFTTDGFVCPVITTEAVLVAENGEGGIAMTAELEEGYYTLAPIHAMDLTVPLLATNTIEEDGDASPAPGDFSSPGDVGYTAIWSGQ